MQNHIDYFNNNKNNDDTYTPDIHSFTVRLLGQHLWSNVACRSNHVNNIDFQDALFWKKIFDNVAKGKKFSETWNTFWNPDQCLFIAAQQQEFDKNINMWKEWRVKFYWFQTR